MAPGAAPPRARAPSSGAAPFGGPPRPEPAWDRFDATWTRAWTPTSWSPRPRAPGALDLVDRVGDVHPVVVASGRRRATERRLAATDMQDVTVVDAAADRTCSDLDRVLPSCCPARTAQMARGHPAPPAPSTCRRHIPRGGTRGLLRERLGDRRPPRRAARSGLRDGGGRRLVARGRPRPGVPPPLSSPRPGRRPARAGCPPASGGSRCTTRPGAPEPSRWAVPRRCALGAAAPDPPSRPASRGRRPWRRSGDAPPPMHRTSDRVSRRRAARNSSRRPRRPPPTAGARVAPPGRPAVRRARDRGRRRRAPRDAARRRRRRRGPRPGRGVSGAVAGAVGHRHLEERLTLTEDHWLVARWWRRPPRRGHRGHRHRPQPAGRGAPVRVAAPHGRAAPGGRRASSCWPAVTGRHPSRPGTWVRSPGPCPRPTGCSPPPSSSGSSPGGCGPSPSWTTAPVPTTTGERA